MVPNKLEPSDQGASMKEVRRTEGRVKQMQTHVLIFPVNGQSLQTQGRSKHGKIFADFLYEL